VRGKAAQTRFTRHNKRAHHAPHIKQENQMIAAAASRHFLVKSQQQGHWRETPTAIFYQ
jgi:hypothetical protein